MNAPIPHDMMNGVPYPPLRISSPEVLHSRQGSIHALPGSRLLIQGYVQGMLYIEAGSVVQVQGRVEGGALIEGCLEICPEGVFAGTIQNIGTVVLNGTFGGLINGPGLVHQGASARIVHPHLRDGNAYYNF